MQWRRCKVDKGLGHTFLVPVYEKKTENKFESSYCISFASSFRRKYSFLNLFKENVENLISCREFQFLCNN